LIELLAGGRAATKAAGFEAVGMRPAARFAVLVVAFGLMTLPAAIGLLALVGVIR
jgi:hypothetical protein